MITRTIFKTHFLKVGLTQHRQTTALRMLITIDLLYLTMREDPLE